MAPVLSHPALAGSDLLPESGEALIQSPFLLANAGKFRSAEGSATTYTFERCLARLIFT
jgi:hypothetical protein